MNRERDDFWGDTPDWTRSTRRSDDAVGETEDGPSDSRRSGLRRWWDAALGSGSDATREHRVLDASAPMYDDTEPLADGGEFDVVWPVDRFKPTRPDHTTEHAAVDHGEPTEETTDAMWDDEWEQIPVGAGFGRGRTIDADASGEHPRTGGIDPLLARIGAVAVVLTLIVPLALGLRSSGDGDVLTASSPEVSTSRPATGPASAPAAPSLADAAAADVQAEPTTDDVVNDVDVLDPSDLPLAVPVNTAEQAPTGDATAETDDAPDADSGSSVASTGSSDATAARSTADSGCCCCS